MFVTAGLAILIGGMYFLVVWPFQGTVVGAPAKGPGPAASAPALRDSIREYATVLAALIAACASLVTAGVTWANANIAGTQNRRTERLKLVWQQRIAAINAAKKDLTKIYYDLQKEFVHGDYVARNREAFLERGTTVLSSIVECEPEFRTLVEGFWQQVEVHTGEANKLFENNSRRDSRRTRPDELKKMWNEGGAKKLGDCLNAVNSFKGPDAPWDD